MRRLFGVRQKLVGLMLLAIVPCVALQAFVVEESFQRAVRRELHGSQAYAQAVGTAFLDYLNSLWASERAVGSAIVVVGGPASLVRAQALLRGDLPAHRGIRGLAWVSPAGVVAASTQAGAVGETVAGSGYFQRLRAGATEAVGDLVLAPGAGVPTIDVARAIRRGGRLQGVVVARLDVDHLRQVLPASRAGGRVFGLVDRSGTVVYRSDTGVPRPKRALPRSVLDPAIGALQGRATLSARFRSPVDGVVRMGAAVPLPPIGWAAFASIPVAQALAGPRSSAAQAFGLLILIALASCLAALAVGRRLLRPVLAMQAAADAISAGDLSARVRLRGGDEPSSTAATFDLMADRVERLLAWQASVASLGQRALAGTRVRVLLVEVLETVRHQLGAEIALVHQSVPERDEMVVRAASGWDGDGPPPAGVVPASWLRSAIEAGEPVIVEDLAGDGSFSGSGARAAGDPVSGVCAVIRGTPRPYGVLGVYARTRRVFSREEAFFVQTVANVLGAAIERRRIEERLRQANTRLETLLEASPVPIVAVDLDGCVTTWNPSAERAFGWPEAQVVGRPLPTVPDGDEDGWRSFRARLTSGEVFEGVVRRRRRDGTLLEVEVSSARVYDVSGQPSGRIAILIDATERTRFLQIAAHELRNPVAGAKGIVALLRRRLAADRPVGQLASTLEVLEHEIDRFSTMLGQMLEAFRVHRGVLEVQREQIDLAAVVRDAVGSFREAHEDFRFELAGADAQVWVRGDELRLEEVFCNLLSNAVKYSGDSRTVRVVLRARAARVTVSVGDAGVGIPADEIGRVFDPFFRARNVGAGDPGGLGLGLFVCREVVRLHGGHLSVESRAGEGTTFHVDLPLDPAESEA